MRSPYPRPDYGPKPPPEGLTNPKALGFAFLGWMAAMIITVLFFWALSGRHESDRTSGHGVPFLFYFAIPYAWGAWFNRWLTPRCADPDFAFELKFIGILSWFPVSILALAASF